VCVCVRVCVGIGRNPAVCVGLQPHPRAYDLRGIPSTKLNAKPGLFCLGWLLSARVAFHQYDLREFPLSNHGNLSDQTNLVGSRLTVRLT
jgi:hypothetical protein